MANANRQSIAARYRATHAEAMAREWKGAALTLASIPDDVLRESLEGIHPTGRAVVAERLGDVSRLYLAGEPEAAARIDEIRATLLAA